MNGSHHCFVLGSLVLLDGLARIFVSACRRLGSPHQFGNAIRTTRQCGAP